MRGEEWCLGTWRILYGSPDSMVVKPLLIALRLSFDTCLGLVCFTLVIRHMLRFGLVSIVDVGTLL